MASVIGNDGSVTMPAGVHGGILNNWRSAFTSVVSETTGFGDSVKRRNRLGMLGIEGSVSGIAQAGVSNAAPGVGDLVSAGSALVLLALTGCSYTFDAAFSGITHNVAKLGDSGLVFDFVGGDADALTIAWTES